MLVLAASVPSFAEIEAACGPEPELQIFDDPQLPADVDADDRGTQVYAVTMPRYWPLGARRGVHCLWQVPDDFRGHFRVRCVDGSCKVQGTLGPDQAMLVEATAIGSVIRMNAAFLPPPAG